VRSSEAIYHSKSVPSKHLVNAHLELQEAEKLRSWQRLERYVSPGCETE
jgi:hypothetical protein